MLDKIIGDLRCIIGVYFALVSTFLLIACTRTPTVTIFKNLNFLASLPIAVFSIFMIMTGIRAQTEKLGSPPIEQ